MSRIPQGGVLRLVHQGLLKARSNPNHNSGEIPTMRKVVCLLALVFLASLSAAAQDSTIDLFAGYSYLHTSPGIKESSFKANGGDSSIAFNLKRWASFVAEAGGVHARKIIGADVGSDAETFMFGPKISFFRMTTLLTFAHA